MFQREAESLTRNQQQMPFKVLEHLFPADEVLESRPKTVFFQHLKE